MLKDKPFDRYHDSIVRNNIIAHLISLSSANIYQWRPNRTTSIETSEVPQDFNDGEQSLIDFVCFQTVVVVVLFDTVGQGHAPSQQQNTEAGCMLSHTRD